MSDLIKIQSELKAPKAQNNTFGNYKYRSCEDILEAVKPLLVKYNLLLTIEDDIIEVGGRVYVKATAKLRSSSEGKTIEVSAFARESETKKGMDEAQITGACSSYARKYALNGLFCIDDTKDADTDHHTITTSEKKKPNPKPSYSFQQQLAVDKMKEVIKTAPAISKYLKEMFPDVENSYKLTDEHCSAIIDDMNERIK